MAKYDPLRDFLLRSSQRDLEIGMDDVAAMVDGGLPPSAYRRRMWWANTGAAQHGHVQAQAWQAAGYSVTAVDFASRRVRFSRTR